MASNDLRERIRLHQEKNKYDKLSAEERLALHKKSYEKLSKIQKGDYYAGKTYLDYK